MKKVIIGTCAKFYLKTLSRAQTKILLLILQNFAVITMSVQAEFVSPKNI
jgi:hypothetical protein